MCSSIIETQWELQSPLIFLSAPGFLPIARRIDGIPQTWAEIGFGHRQYRNLNDHIPVVELGQGKHYSGARQRVCMHIHTETYTPTHTHTRTRVCSCPVEGLLGENLLPPNYLATALSHNGTSVLWVLTQCQEYPGGQRSRTLSSKPTLPGHQEANRSDPVKAWKVLPACTCPEIKPGSGQKWLGRK